MKTLTNRMQLRLIQIKTCTSDIRIQVQFSRIQIVLSYVLHNARHATLICLRIVLYPFDSYAYHSCAFLAVSRILSTIHPFLHDFYFWTILDALRSDTEYARGRAPCMK